MKKALIACFVLSIISFIFMIFNFLASTDIYHDYVSKQVLSTNASAFEKALPEWTNCTAEWQILNIDFMIRIVFMLSVIVVLIMLLRKNRYFTPITNP